MAESSITSTFQTDGADEECRAGTSDLGAVPRPSPMKTLSSQVHYNWVNITDKFKEAASELDLGELIHDSTFGLFEAMSAIEMMDPKMDAGMIPVYNKEKKVLTFKEAIKCGEVKVKDFTVEETVGIMDELISCLVTWLDGHSLIQTVFICLYVHDPYILEDPCIKLNGGAQSTEHIRRTVVCCIGSVQIHLLKYRKVFCIVILKFCDTIRGIINKASVYEEEDFQPMTYGFKLTAPVSDMRISGMLKEAEDEVNRKLKAVKSQRASDDSPTLATEITLLEALWFRLRFMKSFLAAVINLEKADKTSLGKAKTSLSSAQKHLGLAKGTVGLGLQRDNDGKMLGFEPLVNQRLLPPSFPRHTAICDRHQAFVYMENLIKRLDHVCTCSETPALHQLLDFFEHFSEFRPCVLSRSQLQIIFWNNNKVFGQTPLSDILQQSMKQFNSPPSISEKSPLSNNPKAKQFVESFLSMAARPITSLVHCMGHNRARQRDKLGFLLEEFAVLQEEADKVDAELHQMIIAVDPRFLSLDSLCCLESLKAHVHATISPYDCHLDREHFACFGSWVLNRTLNIMIQYLLLGLELQLFSVHEYHYLFWYLDYLFNWQATCLSRASELLQSHGTSLEQKSGKSGKKNKKQKKASDKSLQEHQGMKTFYHGMRNLCSGYMRALEGFQLCGKICQPAEQFDNERIRFEHRFFAFQTVDTPQPRLFSQYQETLNITRTRVTKNSELFVVSAQSFQQAKSIFETLTNMPKKAEGLLKVAKTNFVVMKLAAGGHKHDSQMPPTFDFSIHKAFPTIRLT